MANVKQIKQKTTGTLLDIEDTQARADIASEVVNRTNADNALQEKINTNKNDIGKLKGDLTHSVGLTNHIAVFGVGSQTRQCEIEVNLKANNRYTFVLSDFPNGTINFYTENDYSTGYLGNNRNFNATRKKFDYTPTTDVEKLYLYCWAELKTYNIIIYSNDSFFDLKIEKSKDDVMVSVDKLNDYRDKVDFSSDAVYLSESITKKNKNMGLNRADGTISASSQCFVSDFISLDENEIKEIIYGFYHVDNKRAGICCYESDDESTFIKSYYTYDTSNSNGWARGTEIPSFPNNAHYIRFSGRNDQASGSPSIKVVKALPKENAERIGNLENTVYKLTKKPNPKPIIFDTDFGGDIDDLPSLALLLWAERIGLVDIVGIVSVAPRSGTKDGVTYNAISAMDAVCNYFGVSDMAFGTNKEMSSKTSNYCKSCCEFEHTITDISNIEDAPTFYRRALSSLPLGEKCTVVITGQTNAFSRFLSSSADSFSNLNGIELAREKIDKLVIMGGTYPTGSKETNFSAYEATPHTYNILENYPNEIYFVGGEMWDTHCGNILYDENLTWSILYQGMNEFMTNAFNNGNNQWGYTTLEETWHGKSYAWDCLATMLACENNLAVTGLRLIRGTNSINNDSNSEDYGKNTWVDSDTGKHYYVRTQQGRNNVWHTRRLDSIIKEDAWVSRPVGRVRLPRV